MLHESERAEAESAEKFNPEDYRRAMRELTFFRNGGLSPFGRSELLEWTVLRTYYRLLCARATHGLLCGEWTFEDCERLEREMTMADNLWNARDEFLPEGRPFFDALKAFAWKLDAKWEED